MPFRRRTYRRRRPLGRRFGKKRMYRKRFSRRGSIRKTRGGQNKYLFTRTIVDEVSFSNGATVNPTPNSNAAVPSTLQGYQLNLLPNYSEFQNLFDQYKICAIKVTWEQPFVQVNTISAAGLNTAVGADNALTYQVILHTANDFDQAAPSSLSSLQEYPSYKYVILTNPLRGGKVSRFFKPKQLQAIINTSAVTVSAVTLKNNYLNTSYSTIPHYGLLWYLEQRASNGTPSNWIGDMKLRMKVKYYLAMKNPH